VSAITTRTIRTLRELNDVSGSLKPTAQWLYRGQRDASWNLEPSLERALRRFRIPLSELREYECRLLRQFRRHFHRYSSYLPSEEDSIEWLTYMQHHGAPTRLLDWTYSFNVALFFAIESVDVDSKCAVWVVDNDFLVAEMLTGLSPDEMEIRRKNDKDPRLANKFLEKEANTIVGVNPFRLNERLAVQQGAFLLSRRTAKPFTETFELLSQKNPTPHGCPRCACTSGILT